MREIFGLFFDPVSGELFTPDPSGDGFVNTGFTFLAVETNGLPVNPLQFATKETADKIAIRVAENLKSVNAKVVEINFVPSPVSRRPFPERLIRIETNEGKVFLHNAGLIASSVARVGWKKAIESLAAEITLESGK